MAKNCRGCYYWRTDNGFDYYCHYMILTGEKRGCPAENCDKRKPKPRKRRAKDV